VSGEKKGGEGGREKEKRYRRRRRTYEEVEAVVLVKRGASKDGHAGADRVLETHAEGRAQGEGLHVVYARQDHYACVSRGTNGGRGEVK